MVAGFEFMVITNAISNLIRENKVFRIPSSIQTGKKLGMQLLDDHLLELCMAGKISDEDAIDHSQNPGDIQDRLETMRGGRLAPGQELGDKEDRGPELRT
jgi:twitching motility protein PilT